MHAACVYISGMVPVLLLQSLEPPADFTAEYTGGGIPKGFVMVIACFGVYILPSMLAWKRGSSRRWKITAINLLLGWTVIGWIVSMVLTYAYEPPPDGEVDREHVPGGPRPR
jgi:hypothetical protein